VHNAVSVASSASDLPSSAMLAVCTYALAIVLRSITLSSKATLFMNAITSIRS
jgi:hypothetical protein